MSPFFAVSSISSRSSRAEPKSLPSLVSGDIETALPSSLTFNLAALPLTFRYIDGTELRPIEVVLNPTPFLRNFDNNVSKQ